MKDRLLKFLNKEGLSATVFADKIGVQRSSISHILSGRNNPSYDFILKILEKYDYISAEWLITGRGNMYKSENIPGKIAQFAESTLFDADNAKIQQKQKDSNSNNNIENQFGNIETNSTKNMQFTNVNIVEKIVYFYVNGTFKEYRPSD